MNVGEEIFTHIFFDEIWTSVGEKKKGNISLSADKGLSANRNITLSADKGLLPIFTSFFV